MRKAADYRRQAEECRALARKAGMAEHRELLLHMAETWTSLAEDREQWVQKYPDLAGLTESASREEARLG
jgi:hypothetical protein